MLKEMLVPHIRFSYIFLVLAACFGLLYALQLLGIGTDLIRPDLVRSLHISLMLYGFVPLMMTLLPFALFDKEGVITRDSLVYLGRFLWLWYIFLVFMILSILAGVTRGLPFYDFAYELNGILALAGLFYIVAIIKNILNYDVTPYWVKVSLVLVVISPLALLVLMNPQYGQVEKMLKGPHGDNTLGMSFALVVIYYLAIKLASKKIIFKTKWHFLWQIPLAGYAVSVLYRIFVGTLSYNAEWFFQYLTLLYLPLLYRWWKDAGLSIAQNRLLFISIASFLFADVEGNILFIPSLRHLFHRNDLVVGHAHIAVGIGLLFLALAIIKPYMSVGRFKAYYLSLMLVLMAVVLSISGIEEAGFSSMHTQTLWAFRALFGGLFLAGLLYHPAGVSMGYLKTWVKSWNRTSFYNIAGFLSDGVGGVLLLLFGKALYEIAGIPFAPGYQQIVFGFVAAVGAIHLMGVLYPRYGEASARATVLARIVTAAGFFALYKNGTFGWIGAFICMTDLLFVLVYLIFIKKEPSYEKNDMD